MCSSSRWVPIAMVGHVCIHAHIYTLHIDLFGGFLQWGLPLGLSRQKGRKKNKSSMSIGFSIINHPATGVPPFFENPPCICVFHHGTSICSLTKFRSLGSTLPRPQWRARTHRRWVRHIWSASLPWNLVPFKNGEGSLVEDEPINSNCGRYFMSDLHRFKIFPLVN